MDTLTHGLAGALLSRAMPAAGDSETDRALRRREAWTGFFAAMLPDADAVLSPFSPEFYITQHRGVTHSFVLLPAWALLVAGVAAFWPKGPGAVPRKTVFWRLAAVSALGLLSHILLDWITSWGTMFFAPLSWDRHVLDWVFILDAVLTGLLLLGLLGTRLVSRRSDARGRWAARASLVAASLYVAFCGFRHAEAVRLAERLAPPGAVSLAAIPQPLSPDRWLLLADDGERISASFVDLSRHGREPGVAVSRAAFEEVATSGRRLGILLKNLAPLYRSPDDPDPRVIPKADGPFARAALRDGEDGVFGRFARFPAAHELREPDGGTEVILRDVRFGYLSKEIDPFTYVVGWDARGKLVFEGFPSERWRNHAVALNAAPVR